VYAPYAAILLLLLLRQLVPTALLCVQHQQILHVFSPLDFGPLALLSSGHSFLSALIIMTLGRAAFGHRFRILSKVIVVAAGRNVFLPALRSRRW
jgi:hypothetical protein